MPFIKLKSANGNDIAVKLNGRHLSNVEAQTIFQITMDIANTPAGKMFNAPISKQAQDLGFSSNLTNAELLQFMIFEGKDSIGTKYTYHINLKRQVLSINQNGVLTDIKFSELQTRQEEIKKYLGTMYRTFRSDLINKKMSNFKATTFTYLGKEIQSTMEYNDFLVNDKTLSTNIKFFKNGGVTTEQGGNIFVRPVISNNHYTSWGGKPLIISETEQKEITKNEEERQGILDSVGHIVDSSKLRGSEAKKQKVVEANN